MASAEDYANWIVQNQDKKGTPEFETVAKAYQAARAAPVSQESPTSFRNLLGAATEPLMHLGSGSVATPIAGLTGMVSGALGGDAAKTVRDVSEKLTYQPKTQGGKTATEAITYPFQKVAEGATKAGEVVSDASGSPALGAGVDTALQAIPMVLGAKFAPSGVPTPGFGWLDKAASMPGKALSATGQAAYRIIEPRLPGGLEDITTRRQVELAGPARQQIVDALLNAKQLVPGSAPTAGEAIASIPEATQLAAHQKAMSRAEGNAPNFQAREAAQEAARANALDTVAQTPEALTAAKAERAANAQENYGAIKDKLVNPASDVQLMQEAIANRAASKASALQDAGRFSTIEAENLTRAGDYVPVPGMPRVAGRVSEFPERAAEGSAAAKETLGIARQRFGEEKFLSNTMDLLGETVGLSDKSLTPLLSRPSMRAAVQDAIKGAQETGSYFPTKLGDKFSIANLQRMKQSLDDAVSDPASFGIKATEAKEIAGTREAFKNWLSNRSPEWRDARLQYAEDSRPINQMEVGQYLKDKLTSPLDSGTERAGPFSQAVRDAPGTIKRSTGQPMYDELSQVLTQPQNDVVQAILGDLSRKAQYESSAKGTNLAGPAEASPLHLPNLLSRPMMATNWVMKLIQGDKEGALNKIAGDRYLDPQKLAEVLKDQPPGVTQMLMEEIMKRKNAVATGAASAEAERN